MGDSGNEYVLTRVGDSDDTNSSSQSPNEWSPADAEGDTDAALALIPDSTLVPGMARVCVSGSIGAGKTFLATGLSKMLGYTLYEEPVKANPWIEHFYADKKATAFPCQVHFLGSRFKQYAESFLPENVSATGVVTDRCAQDDVVFARLQYESGDMSKIEFQTYTILYEAFVANIGANIPDVVLFLDAPTEILMERIRSRARSYESSDDSAGGITAEYLGALSAQYERYLQDMGRITSVYRLDWYKFHSAEEVWAALQEQHTGEKGVRVLQM